jgi:CDP-diacylglycerol--inositol 3-phosphatidyltransferase
MHPCILTPTKKVVCFFCAGNEPFFFALYLIKWDTRPLGLSLSQIPAPPLFTVLPEPRVEGWITRLTFAQVLAMVTFLICFFKNVINAVQGWKASKILRLTWLKEGGKATHN